MQNLFYDDLVIGSSFSFKNDAIIYLGDCRDLLATIPDKSLQLIITSPPYNIGKEYEKKMSLSDYYNFQREIIHICVEKLKDTGSLCWQVGNFIIKDSKKKSILPLDIFLYPIFQENNLILRNRIIWHFGHGLHASNRFSGRYETIMWYTKSDNYTFNLNEVRVPQKYPGKKHFKGPKKGQYSSNPLGKNPSDVWEIPNVKANHVEKTIHPAQFPMALIERLVKSLSDPDDIIFDPFLGVGTTSAIAILNKRKAVGAEIEKKYYKIALKRIEEAVNGTLSIREDKPVYMPPLNSQLTINPF